VLKKTAVQESEKGRQRLKGIGNEAPPPPPPPPSPQERATGSSPRCCIVAQREAGRQAQKKKKKKKKKEKTSAMRNQSRPTCRVKLKERAWFPQMLSSNMQLETWQRARVE
jgi:hypothetical protein